MQFWEKLISDPIKFWVFVILMTVELIAFNYLVFAWIRDTKHQKNVNSSNKEEVQDE